jgi:hypothetical protein
MRYEIIPLLSPHPALLASCVAVYALVSCMVSYAPAHHASFSFLNSGSEFLFVDGCSKERIGMFIMHDCCPSSSKVNQFLIPLVLNRAITTHIVLTIMAGLEANFQPKIWSKHWVVGPKVA